MTARELIAAGFSYQETHPTKNEAETWAQKWRSKGFLAAILFIPTSGKWEVWVK